MITDPSKEESPELKKEALKTKIYTIDDCLPDMLHDLEHGKQKGTTTYNNDIDQCWTWRKEEFNIWTGYANEGKSLFIKQLCMPKALKADWKFAFCSPEDYPPSEFFDDMIHTLSGLTTDRDRKNVIKKDLYLHIVEKIKQHFYFVYIDPPNNTIKGALERFRQLHEDVGLDGCIIDPLLKFARPKGFSERDDIYASYIGSICVDFARKTQTSLHLVMHQLTPRIGDDKKYPQPSMYSMKGGGSWADGADNVLSVWRPNYAMNKQDDEVEFASQKIKKQKLVGLPQRLKLKFNRVTNRYIDYSDGTPIFDFDKMIWE
jgi:twinkle protein